MRFYTHVKISVHKAHLQDKLAFFQFLYLCNSSAHKMLAKDINVSFHFIPMQFQASIKRRIGTNADFIPMQFQVFIKPLDVSANE